MAPPPRAAPATSAIAHWYCVFMVFSLLIDCVLPLASPSPRADMDHISRGERSISIKTVFERRNRVATDNPSGSEDRGSQPGRNRLALFPRAQRTQSYPCRSRWPAKIGHESLTCRPAQGLQYPSYRFNYIASVAPVAFSRYRKLAREFPNFA
jgi:hypothetical protein